MRNNKTSDLIDDRALVSADPDQFNLDDFAIEIERLSLSANTPANIALYAPWGSGKSSLANLLSNRFAINPNVHFVRYDAFKYAETPLRRHFLSQVARQLGLAGKDFVDTLYSHRQKKEIEFPPAEVLKLTLLFVGVFATLSALVALVPSVIHYFLSDEAWEEWKPIVAELMGGAALVSVVASAFVALAGKSFVSKVTKNAPSSEEEFDSQFRELVAKLKGKRLIVFIDELDRCSPAEVVTTLETLRTFLEVEGCIFIVAADQSALELALTHKARQTTPNDSTNPHYSAGSEYLDKIFQYQIALPDKTPRRLSQFALDLVRGVDGIWQEIDQETVVSVLIPTHVRSPRRVKALLNGFAIAYRLTKKRSDDGAIAGVPSERAAELAKLVCLRHEFPLFARDLASDWRLPDYVVSILNNEEVDDKTGVSELIMKRANEYANKKLPVAQTINDDVFSSGEQIEEAESGGGQTVVTEDMSTSNVEGAHATQLVAYLQKTEYVETPKPDLIYLEGAGQAFGLDPVLDELLERNAVNGQVKELSTTLSSLTTERQVVALRFLGHVAREASVGVEGGNVVSALLRAISTVDESVVQEVASELADAVGAHQRAHQLRLGDLPGALLLGLYCEKAIGRHLVASVFAREDIGSNFALCRLLVKESERLLSSGVNKEKIAKALCVLIVEDAWEPALNAIMSVNDETMAHLLSATADPLMGYLRPDGDADDEEKSGSEGMDKEDLVSLMTELLDYLKEENMPESVKESSALLLALNCKQSRDAFETRIADIGPFSRASLVNAVVRHVVFRRITLWPKWLDPISSKKGGVEVPSGQLDGLIAKAFNSACDAENVREESVAAAVRSLRRLYGGNGMQTKRLQDAIAGRVEHVDTDEELQKQAQVLVVISSYVAERVIGPEALSGIVTPVFLRQCQTRIANTALKSRYEKHHKLWLPRIAKWLKTDDLRRLSEAVLESQWIEHPSAEAVILEMYAIGHANGTALPRLPFDHEEIGGFVDEDASAMVGGVSAWLDVYDPHVETARPVLERYRKENCGDQLLKSIEDYTGRMHASARRKLIIDSLGTVVADPPSEDYLSAIRIGQGYEDELAEKLVDLFNDASNNEQRANILFIWKAWAPTKTSVCATLVRSVYIPLLGMGKQAFEIAYKERRLVIPPPHGVKMELVRELQKEAKNNNCHKKVKKALVEADMIKEKKKGAGWFGKQE